MPRSKNLGGRPSFKPTANERYRVALGASTGMTREQLAAAVGITIPTLLKHFEAELTTGAANMQIEMVRTLYEAGKGGNASAAKAFIALTSKAHEAFVPPLPRAERPEPKGKKEQANEDAKTAHVGSDWADLLPTSVAQ